MLAILSLALMLPAADGPRPAIVVAVGAPGQPEYASTFRETSDAWEAAAKKGGADFVRVGSAATPGDKTTDRDRLREAIEARSAESTEPLWVVLIGHGTFDGREAKFNLQGPDLTDADLVGWLAAVKRPVVFVNGASSSGPFLNKLSGPGRVIITATRSGDEQNFARFGEYLAGAVADRAADLDKDGQTSALEAYLTAGRRVEEFYSTRSRLATEHALLDDNGDGLGTPPDFFRGVRAVKRPRDGAALDGVRAHQIHLVPSDREAQLPAEFRRKRDALEQSIAALRDQKESTPEDEYYRQLEPLMLDLSKLYQALEASPR